MNARAGSLWSDRRSRALACLSLAPHAEHLLAFYAAVLEEQGVVAERIEAEGSPWLRPGPSGAAGPPSWVNDAFGGFVHRLSTVAPETLALAGERLTAISPPARGELLLEFARSLRPGSRGTDRPRDPAEVFFPRAFLEPFRVDARTRTSPGPAPTPSPIRSCPFCGESPVVALVRDEEDVKGRRSLVCGGCAHAWSYPRATCPACGETDSERLIRHTAANTPHVAVCECQACRCYLKEVDLRIQGTAEPVVDDIATPELDLWAGERGLRKVSLNLLGL